MPLAQRLLWLPNTATHHPESGARVQEQDTVLQIFFAQRTALLRLPLGVSADSGNFLGELPLLEEALDETPYSPAEVLGFAVMGEPVEAEVWLGAGVDTVSWDVYQAGMAQANATLAAPPPTAEALRALPQVREAWLLAQTTGGYFSDEKGQPVLSQLTLLASPSGLVRSVNVGSELPEPSES